ncbi:MAG TPA: hypothetical protein VFZ24_05810 [Longimicrobiales bacterium]
MRDRVHAMLERVDTEARAALGDTAARRVRAALAEALALRDAAINDDRDTRLLHPARTIRILIADGACRSADALAAAACLDTIDPALAPEPPPLLRPIVNAVPRADPGADDQLLEQIVTADHDTALLALAERLDHVRHLHLRRDLDPRPLHAQVREVYAPAARRFSAQIARRFDRWADAFERRLVFPR